MKEMKLRNKSISVFCFVFTLMLALCMTACGSKEENETSTNTVAEAGPDISEAIIGTWTYESTWTKEEYGGITGKLGDSVTSKFEFYEGNTGRRESKNNTNPQGRSISQISWEVEKNLIKIYFNGAATSTYALKYDENSNTLVSTMDSSVVFQKQK